MTCLILCLQWEDMSNFCVYSGRDCLILCLQWEDLYASKPDDNYEDPSDVEAIREAKENMGDYKLKTAKDYVVPDHLRMNVEKARGRLLVLKDQVCRCCLSLL